MAKKPRMGSEKWVESLADDPAHARAVIGMLVRRAETGDKEAAENLLKWLERHPEMRNLVRDLDDLATRVERAWVARLGGASELARKAVADDVAALRRDLLGVESSVCDRLLAGTVMVAYLSHQRAALNASASPDQPEIRAAHDKLLSQAQKRLQEAIRGWELHAGKKRAGERPPAGLKLFEASSEPEGVDGPDARPASQPARKRP